MREAAEEVTRQARHAKMLVADCTQYVSKAK